MSLTLVTGASRGIGAAFAAIAAAQGRDLVLTARNEEDLTRLATELRNTHRVNVFVIPADLSEDGAADRVWSAAGEVTRLINNAGLAAHGAFTDPDQWAREAQSIHVNLLSATVLLKRALRDMPGRGGGRILNVSSLSAFLPGPGMAVYHATKAYLLALSEAAAQEAKASGVTVTALCPGPTKSGFFEAAGMDGIPLLKMAPQPSAEAVARAGWRAMEAGRRVVVPGAANKLAAALSHVVPHALLLPITHALMSRR